MQLQTGDEVGETKRNGLVEQQGEYWWHSQVEVGWVGLVGPVVLGEYWNCRMCLLALSLLRAKKDDLAYYTKTSPALAR